MRRVLLASLWQESNSFVPTRTTLDDFRHHHLLVGQDVVEKLRGGGLEVSGAIAAAEEDAISLVPVLAAYSRPAGPLTGEAYAYLRERIVEGARHHASEVDGAMLALHGAMLTEDLDDPEGDLIAAVRQALGPDKPIVCSLDLHAHVTDQMIGQSTALVGYHTHPHVDFYETGFRAMKLLGRVLRGEVHPAVRHCRLAMLACAEKHNTSRPPMADVMSRLLAMEREPAVLSASVFADHESLDVPDLGWCIIVVSDGDARLAQVYADELGQTAWERRHQFIVQKTPVQEALRIARETPGGPIVLADAGDATSGGGEGDSTYLLQALLGSPVPGTSLLLVTDPEAVAECVAAGVGAELTVEVGGKLTPVFFQPVRVSGRVCTISDGVFQMKLPPMPADRGRTVVLQVGDVHLVLSERAAMTFDEEVYRSVGLFPREAKIVQVKSHGGFRPVYEPFARAVVEVDTPGPCDTTITRLPYKRITRPVFPLDDL